MAARGRAGGAPASGDAAFGASSQQAAPVAASSQDASEPRTPAPDARHAPAEHGAARVQAGEAGKEAQGGGQHAVSFDLDGDEGDEAAAACCRAAASAHERQPDAGCFVFPLGAALPPGVSAESLVESAASILAALRACSGPGGAGGSLLSSTRHLDVTAEAEWGVAHGVAASGLDDAAALLEQFRAALLARHGSRSGTAQQLLGSSARPLHVHLAAGGGPCAHAHPRGVLVVRSVEDAQVLLCALLLGGGAACCVATAAPALPQAYRDVLVQGGHVGTARPALLQAAPGVTPAWRGTFTAAAFAARGDADAGVGARRAMWAEFLGEELLVRGGTPALLRFARCAVEPDAEPCAVEAALEAAAEVAYGKGASFSRLASQWAHATWALLAAETPNEWAGGVGSKIGDDPSVADKSGPTAAATAEEDDEDVTPDPEEAKGGEENKLGPSISVAQCWGWMLRWLWAEKRRDLMWCLAAILWNCLWTLYSPVILTDLINEADFVAKAGENDSTDSVEMRTQHNGLLPDYLITNHISYFIILVCASFFGQVTTVLMNRQLFIKTPCNPGFVLEEGFKLSRHIGALPQLFMDTAKLSQIANVLDQDLPLVGAAVSYSFTAVYCSVMLATSLALLFTIDRDMALALLAMIPVYGFVAFVHGRKNGQMSALLRREERKFKSFREELLFMSSVKRTLGQDAALEGKLAEKAAATCDRSDKLCVHTAIMQQHLAFINVLFNVFIIGYGLYLVMNGTLTVGAWVAFYSAAGSATPLLPTLAEASRQWQLAREALTLVRGLQALKPEQFRCTRALASGDVALVIDRVSFTYFPSPGQMSLVNVSAVVPAGSKVALCGRSGCGKTTLLRLLSRLYQPTSGCIYVSGIGLNQLDMSALVSVVEQEIVLFDLSIRENIRIARPESTDKEVEEAAVRAAVAPDIALLDGGYNFAVGPRGRLLSGGQRQRVGFARALLRDSPMLLMDEPVSAQDGETLAAMAESVTSLRRLDGTPVTVISSSHSLAFFSKFTFAMYLANKTLQEWGTVEELKAKRGLYFQLVAAQEGMSVDDSGRAKLDPAKLRTVWLFAKLKAEQLARLAAMFTSRRVGAGEQLYGAGDVQDTCYIIASGRLELRRPPPKTARGKAVKRTLRTLEPGACCNEECLLRDITPAHDAFADGPVVLLACARVYFDMTLVAVPAIAEAVKDIVARRDEFVTAATLRHAWPLTRLSDAAAAAVISDAFRIDVVPARTVLCEPGAPCAAMHVVLSGTVALTEGDGEKRRCCAGAVFGEASLLADVAAEPAEPRLTRAASVEECVVAVLPRDALGALMERDAAVRSALREVADAWLAARAPAALARHWLLAPLVAADGAGGSVLRSLSSAVHTRLLARGEQLCTQRSAAPAVCVLGKLLDTWAPSGGGPQLVRELGPGALAAPETLLLSQSCASVAVEAAEASIVACLPRGALAAAAAALPAAAAATAALLAAYQAALTPSAFAALGLADVPPEALVDLAGLCEPRVLRPGEAVFDGGRAAAPWLARVLWGEVATRQGGTAAAGQLLRTDAAAALAPRATAVSSTGDAASAHAGAAPTAVVLLMDVGALVGPAAEARHLRAAKLLAQAAARAAQQERIAHLKRTVSLARMALEGTAAQATRCAGARARCGFRSAARGVQAAVRLRQALAPAGASLEETEAAVRALLAHVDAEVATRRAERQRRCAALRAAWESLEAPTDVPTTAQDALDACRDDVSRAALAALAEALADADAALAARRAEVAAEEEAVRSLLTLMGPEPADSASAATLRRLSSAGLQRSVVEELGALRRALDAEQASRLAAQAATRAALTDIRLAMARAGASYDAARLPPAAPTLAAVRAHDAALARATAALAPVLAATRAELEALAEKLRLPPARRARFAPTTPPEAPSGALLTRLLDERAQLREADEIVTNALTGPPEPPPPPPKPAREPSSAAKDREAWLEERRRGWVGAP